MISNPFTGQTLNALGTGTQRLITGFKGVNKYLEENTPKDYGHGEGWNLHKVRKMTAKKIKSEKKRLGTKSTARKYAKGLTEPWTRKE